MASTPTRVTSAQFDMSTQRPSEAVTPQPSPARPAKKQDSEPVRTEDVQVIPARPVSGRFDVEAGVAGACVEPCASREIPTFTGVGVTELRP